MFGFSVPIDYQKAIPKFIQMPCGDWINVNHITRVFTHEWIETGSYVTSYEVKIVVLGGHDNDVSNYRYPFPTKEQADKVRDSFLCLMRSYSYMDAAFEMNMNRAIHECLIGPSAAPDAPE